MLLICPCFWRIICSILEEDGKVASVWHCKGLIILSHHAHFVLETVPFQGLIIVVRSPLLGHWDRIKETLLMPLKALAKSNVLLISAWRRRPRSFAGTGYAHIILSCCEMISTPHLQSDSSHCSLPPVVYFWGERAIMKMMNARLASTPTL